MKKANFEPRSARAGTKNSKKAGPTPQLKGHGSATFGPFKPSCPTPRLLPPPVVAPSGTSLVARPESGLLEQVGREADEALAIGKRVLGLLNVESKALSYTFTPTSVTYTAVAYNPLASITQGDTDSSRDGDSLKLKGWLGNLLLTRGGVDAIVSYCFVQQGPTFLTNVSQVYEYTGTVSAPLSQPNWDSRKGFRILKHGICRLTASDPYAIIPFDLRFNHDVQYYSAGVVVYQGDVAIYLVSNNAGGGTQPTWSLGSQVSWVDN